MSSPSSPYPRPAVSLRITAGPDGNLWFTEENGNQIGQINPTTHAITPSSRSPRPVACPSVSLPGPMATSGSPCTAGKIGQINPATHAIVDFPIPTSNGNPAGITAGPDGNIWFTELGNKIGQAVLTVPPTAPDLCSRETPPAW